MGRVDVSVPLPGVKEVQVIRIDGSRRALNAGSKALTLTIGEDPLLLLYDCGESTLPPSLDAPLATLETPRGQTNTFTVRLSGAGGSGIDLIAPPFWTV